MNKNTPRYRAEFENGVAIEGTDQTIILALSTRTEDELERLRLYQLIPVHFLWWRFYKKLPVDSLVLTTFLLRALKEEIYVEDQAA